MLRGDCIAADHFRIHSHLFAKIQLPVKAHSLDKPFGVFRLQFDRWHQVLIITKLLSAFQIRTRALKATPFRFMELRKSTSWSDVPVIYQRSICRCHVARACCHLGRPYDAWIKWPCVSRDFCKGDPFLGALSYRRPHGIWQLPTLLLDSWPPVL